MKTKEFDYELPPELIANYPSKNRGDDKLMFADRTTHTYTHQSLSDLPDLIPANSLLVFNDSRVRKARLFGTNNLTNKNVEFLLLRQIDGDGYLWRAMSKNNKQKKTGDVYHFGNNDDDIRDAGLIQIENQFLTLQFCKPLNDMWLEKNGHIPLPPYIKRPDESVDDERYQTIYAKTIGSSAAPTAGLHFTDSMLHKLSACGIEITFITLHVGLGTFLPVYSENIEEHKMHTEYYMIDDETAEQINNAKKQKRKIIAVGTTSLRTLESAFNVSTGEIQRGEQSTDIFIYPPYKFNITDGLFTNFHTPQSSLLMLVCAFAGYDFIMETYMAAIKERYKFFSYGDAMLIL